MSPLQPDHNTRGLLNDIYTNLWKIIISRMLGRWCQEKDNEVYSRGSYITCGCTCDISIPLSYYVQCQSNTIQIMEKGQKKLGNRYAQSNQIKIAELKNKINEVKFLDLRFPLLKDFIPGIHQLD